MVSWALVSWQWPSPVRADDEYAQSAARLEKMTADQKDDLRRKKSRFDALNPAEQQKLRDLHASITSDPSSKELLETVKSAQGLPGPRHLLAGNSAFVSAGMLSVAAVFHWR